MHMMHDDAGGNIRVEHGVKVSLKLLRWPWHLQIKSEPYGERQAAKVFGKVHAVAFKSALIRREVDKPAPHAYSEIPPIRFSF